MKGQIKKIIYNWVKQTYGQSEANNPSWNIKALADHLSRADIDPDELSANTKSNVYRALDQHYVEEDVEEYANDRGYELTEQQIGRVADDIRNSDWYCNINSEDMEWYINRELAIAKEKGE